MRSNRPWLQGPLGPFTLASSLLLTAGVLAGCPGPKPQPAAGTDAGADAGSAPVVACAPEGTPCASAPSCCGNLSCQGGVCLEKTPPRCAAFFEGCSASVPCCAPPAPDGGYPPGAVPPVAGCLTIDAGVSLCFMGTQPGDPCGAGRWGCTNGLVCAHDQCAFPSSGASCPSDRDGGVCLPGDDCGSKTRQGISPINPDPCVPSGLVCTQGLTGFLCDNPAVVGPPNFPIAESAGADTSICNASSDCQPLPGDSAATTCALYTDPLSSFTDPTSGAVSVCTEACAEPDDCGSLAWDCLGGACLPNYCYAQNDQTGADVAGEITLAQGTKVSSSVSVLFKPCAQAGPNTVCLPQNDNLWNTTTGICYRVGDSSAGAVGAGCDPSGARTNLGAICQTGSLCYKGTCLRWCDTGNPAVAGCAQGEQCVSVGGALVSSTANANGTGVCAALCDPYLASSQNGCPTADAGQPTELCKPVGTDNDIYPPPGVCMGGGAEPIEVGQPCSPFGWVDPCVSGALCLQIPSDGGNAGNACQQICDPSPSPGQSPPGCPSGTHCQGLGPPTCYQQTNQANNFACYHVGACQ